MVRKLYHVRYSISAARAPCSNSCCAHFLILCRIQDKKPKGASAMPSIASVAQSSVCRLAPYRERRALLSARYPRWLPKTMDVHLADVASRYPDRPLILADDATLSYADVVERS